MAYREAAEPAARREAPPMPLERHTVARYSRSVAPLIFLGILAYWAGLSWSFCPVTMVTCSRVRAGDVPTCVVVQTGISATTTPPFALTEGALGGLEADDGDDGKHWYLTTPTGRVGSAVGKSFVDEVAAGAAVMLRDSSKMTWEARHARTFLVVFMAATGLGLLLPLVLILGRHVVTIDRGGRTVSVAFASFKASEGTTYSFDELRSARKEDVDDSFPRLVFDLKSGPVSIAQGREADVAATARAVNAAVRRRKPAEAGEEAGTDDASSSA